MTPILRKRVLLCGALSAGALVLGGEACAQAPSQVEEIIVTAQRRSEAINDVGMSITALGGEQLARQGVSDIRDLVKVVPGLSFAESQKGAPIYTLRGVGFYEESLAASPAVSVYVDEVGYAFPITAKGATLDVERVEVLKGPQGTLYGQNSTGGAINYIAAKPTEQTHAGIEAGYGRFGAASLNGFVSGRLTDTVRARFAASVDEGGAWQRSASRGTRNGDADVLKGRLLVDWDASDKLSLSLNLNGWRDRSDTTAVALYRVTPQTPSRVLPIVAAQTPVPEKPGAADWSTNRDLDSNLRYGQAALRADYALSDRVALTSITSYQTFKQAAFRDTDGSALEVFSVEQTGKIESVFQEVRASGDSADQRLNWTLGASYAHDDTQEANTSFLLLTTSARAFVGLGLQPFAAALAQSKAKIETAAAFGNVQWAMSDDLKLNAGARYTRSENAFAGCMRDVDGNLAAGLNIIQARTKATLPGRPAVVTIQRGECITLDGVTFDPGLVHDDLNQNNLSWRVGLDWKVAPGNLVYATVSKGYKSGNFPNINATTSISLAPVTQESVLAYELGVKSQLGATLQLDAAVFYYDYVDKQFRARILDPSGVFGASEALINVPQSRALGAEVSTRWRPVDGLTLDAAATYLDTEVTKSFRNYDPFGASVDFKGDRFPFAPRWALLAGARYDWRLSDDLTAFVGANASYQTRSTSAFGGSRLVEIDGYGLLDLHAGFETEDNHWRVTAWARNVTNTYYWTDTFRQIDNLSRHVGKPATYGVEVGYRY